MIEELESHKEAILQPISDAEPCGEDPKYEDDYSEIKEEVAKMSALGTGSPDWDKVEENTLKLLKSTAKEINLLAYLGVAWTIKHQLAGYIVGAEIAAETLLKFWDDMYPSARKERIRARAVDWFQARLLERFDSCKSTDRELLQRGIDATKKLKDAIYEKFQDPPVNFRKLRNQLEEWLAQAPEPKPEPPPAPKEEPKKEEPARAAAPAPAAAPAAPAAAAPTPKPAAAKGPPVAAPTVGDDASLDEVYKALGQIALNVQKAEPTLVHGFQIRRIAAWSSPKVPNHNATRETMIRPPDANAVKSMETMYSASNWAGILPRCEAFTSAFPYWLDLQFWATEAAAGMGHDAVVSVIKEETRRLLDKCPELVDIKFQRGMPFASPVTKDWVEKLMKEGAGGGGGEEDPAAILRGDLRKIGKDAFGEGMRFGQAAIAEAKDLRTALRMRVEVAGYCLEADQPAWADALLRGLTTEVERYRLNEFEPSVAARIWRLLLESSRQLKVFEPSHGDMERHAMRELAQLDLGQAGEFPVVQQNRPGGVNRVAPRVPGPAKPKPAGQPAGAAAK
ncbi:type VI secretion system protein TssA [Sulfidibacter corallicola]|uniref:Type VI secretion system protein TssA n=1 Tax=Sulfidibacter corallicola TaxID=2818388 RepID=A0A8A4TTT8_SULCO|nr:type VI secretion system protein TssA [Sulfidibacter corallicola]QTD53386.1 type VI secretion system protein TssA [Sulfidibacter corallicola]